MIDTTIQQRIETKLLELLLLAQNDYKTTFEIPQLLYKQIGRVAGRANYPNWRITLNPDFLRNGHLEDMINQTLGHELAHLIAWKVYKSWGHDWKWRIVMRALGLEPDRCHSYSLEGVKCRQVRKVMAKCPTCGVEFPVTLRRAAQIRAGLRIWHSGGRCKYVKARLVLVGEEPVKESPVSMLASVLA